MSHGQFYSFIYWGHYVNHVIVKQIHPLPPFDFVGNPLGMSQMAITSPWDAATNVNASWLQGVQIAITSPQGLYNHCKCEEHL